MKLFLLRSQHVLMLKTFNFLSALNVSLQSQLFTEIQSFLCENLPVNIILWHELLLAFVVCLIPWK